MRKTAGELAHEISKDTTKYDMLEVGHAVCEDIPDEIYKCIDAHNPIFDMDEYYVVMLIVKDSLNDKLWRRKFYAYPFMPKPRPNQSVFLYNKPLDRIKRLWVLPNAAAMSMLSELVVVDPNYYTMKKWSDAFFEKKFWETIREEQNRKDLLSEDEALSINWDKLVKAREENITSLRAQSTNETQVHANEFIDARNAITLQESNNNSRNT